MRPTALLRALSFRPPAAPVAPWPPVQTALDKWLTSELDDLRLRPHCYSASWLSQALDLAIATQTKIISSIAATPHNINHNTLNHYLDDTVDLLDACSGLRDRIESIMVYTDSLSTASRRLDNGCAAAVDRARTALDSCEAMERRFAELAKCGSNLRKLWEKLACAPPEAAEDDERAEIQEALSGSRAVALLVVGMLGVTLSFKSRRGVPALVRCGKSSKQSWVGVMHEVWREAKEEVEKRRRDGAVGMRELDSAVAAAQNVRVLIDGRRKFDGRELRREAEELRRRCMELEEKVRAVGERVDELYRRLISVRVSLLGVLSEA